MAGTTQQMMRIKQLRVALGSLAGKLLRFAENHVGTMLAKALTDARQ